MHSSSKCAMLLFVNVARNGVVEPVNQIRKLELSELKQIYKAYVRHDFPRSERRQVYGRFSKPYKRDKRMQDSVLESNRKHEKETK